MDEEDGRLGPLARKFGRADVFTDALTRSLCYSPSFSILKRSGTLLRFSQAATESSTVSA
jgi:hypothetical protein